METRITAIANQKGGVGKSTTAAALAAGLLQAGRSALLIDADTQGNITYSAGANEKRPGLYELLRGKASAAAAIQQTAQGDIISSSGALAASEFEFNRETAGDRWAYLLKDAIAPLAGKYQHIVIDTPPQLGTLTANALTAATDVIITVQADIFSLQGLAALNETIKQIKARYNPGLKIAGILITRYQGRTILARDLKASLADAAAHMGTKLYSTTIREGIAIKEAQALNRSIFDAAPKSGPALDYAEFITEYLKTE